MKYALPILAVVGALMFLTAPAVAEDLRPPPWRGEWSTTSQVWEFSRDSIPWPPDDPPTDPPYRFDPDGPAPGGQPPLPSTHLWVQPGPPPWEQWLEQDEPFEYPPGSGNIVGLGVWPLSGWIEATIDNHDPWKPKKLMWVQLTWRPQEGGGEPIFTYIDPPPVEPPELVEEIPLGPLWRHSTYAWELPFNPPDEVFRIEGTINVDELVVDTWCIPEPGVVAMLLGVGLMALAASARRRLCRKE